MKTKNRKTGKRVGALILALTMCFSLMAGCNQNNAPANSSNPGGSSAPGSSAGGSGSSAPEEAPLPGRPPWSAPTSIPLKSALTF